MAKSSYDELMAAIGANDERQEVRQWLSTGVPELNKALSGNAELGLPVGRMVEIFGGSSCGKTFLATQLMIEAQRAGGIAAFSDHERSFDANLARSLGLNTDAQSGQWIYKRPQTFEESVEIAVKFCEVVRQKKLIADDAPLIWVFDSVAAMVPREKLYDEKGNRREVGDYNMRDKLALATATSQSYPMLAQFAEDNNMLVLLLNQIRMKPGVMFGDPTTTPGGNAAEFYCSARISLGKKQVTNGKTGAEKKIVGNDVTAKVVKNKVSRPFETAAWRVTFVNHGAMLDLPATILDHAVRAGVLDKKSGYIEFDGKKYREKELRIHLTKDREALDKLSSQLY